jgi:hypothetical protein
LACDPGRNLGLYEFIEGRILLPEELAVEHVEQAIDFYRDLNRHKGDAAARTLPRASEACFTLGEHLACVERRVERLVALENTTAEGREASRLVHVALIPSWQQIHKRAVSAATGLPPALDEPLPRQDQRLSPSDFGFHNAILAADGRLRFIDFEYAGWDDPAKTVCDFLCQPAVPVPGEWADPFARALVSDLSDPDWHLRRVGLLRDVYRVKWCCILLNDFLPAGRQRRLFAQDAGAESDRRRAQLHKVGRAVRELCQ